ncbi:MAG: T9SS type A sorting domain-containing protein [Candidatus Marinimicrobia bacterium]|nr:T9SS type A sorting domain-containing protein [Candidatus Neomarinimicrobiota bacterium]
MLLQVEFSPNSVGAKQLLLSIASNDVTNAIANIYFDGFGLLYITGAEEHKTTGNLLVEVKLLDNLLSVTNNEQQELKLHLYNSLGQIVLVGEVGGNSQTVFDLQSLNSGSYFLIAVGQGEAIHSVKFIYTK